MVNAEKETGKLGLILKAAQNRLGFYGYEKTSMQEIADDIGMSKAALYYYFPDKESLFKAVVENEREEFFNLVERRMSEIPEADRMIMELVELRHSLYRRFWNLSKFRFADEPKVRPLMLELYQKLRRKEVEILVRILQSGRDAGLFTFEDAEMMAHLFSDMLQGIRIMVKKRSASPEMTEEENEYLIQMLREAARLFVNGLKYNKIIINLA